MLAEDDYLVVGSGIAEGYHRRFFDAVPRPASVRFTRWSVDMAGFNVAGPLSRDLLQRLTDTSLDTTAFPFLRSARMRVADVPVTAIRVSFTGDLGWELHCDAADQDRLYAALIEAGAGIGAGPVGARALGSLRLEKGYGSWGREYSPEYWPHEAGLDGLVRLDKDFLNKAACAAVMGQPPRERLGMVEVLDTAEADASGGEPIFTPDGRPVGRVTTGGYGFGVGASLALAYLRGVAPGDEVSVMILGQPHRGRVLLHPPFDPEGLRLRG